MLCVTHDREDAAALEAESVVRCESFFCLAGYFLSLAKESNQRTPFKERGIISPFLTDPFPETTKGEGLRPPLWKPHPWGVAIINCAFAAKRQGRWRPLAAV